MRTTVNSDNAIVFDSTGFKTREDFQLEIGKTLDILTKQNYMCSFRYEDVGIYVLEFDHADPKFGGPMIYWLDSDQVDCLYTSSFISEDDEDDKKGCCCCKDVG